VVTRIGSPQKLFRNDGTTWTEVGAATGVAAVSGTYRGAMFIDYDNDGFLDIFFNESSKKLLHNEGGNGNHWIGIRPKGVTSNRAAIGARITAVVGSLRQIRDIQGGGGGMSQCYLWAHFGLGSATAVDSLIVRWPDNTTEVALNVAANEYYIFEEGTGIISSVRDNPIGVVYYELFQNYPNPFNPSTTFEFSLAAGSDIRLQLVNILGEVVKVLASGNYPAGHHQVKLDAVDLAAGIYFYKLKTDKFVQVKKLVLLK
jgi:hypothetical protein